jgi:hypothetical protein
MGETCVLMFKDLHFIQMLMNVRRGLMSATWRCVSMNQEATGVGLNPQMYLNVKWASSLTTPLTHVLVCSMCIMSVILYMSYLLTFRKLIKSGT